MDHAIERIGPDTWHRPPFIAKRHTLAPLVSASPFLSRSHPLGTLNTHIAFERQPSGRCRTINPIRDRTPDCASDSARCPKSSSLATAQPFAPKPRKGASTGGIPSDKCLHDRPVALFQRHRLRRSHAAAACSPVPSRAKPEVHVERLHQPHRSSTVRPGARLRSQPAHRIHKFARVGPVATNQMFHAFSRS